MILDEAIRHAEEIAEEKRYEYQECLAVHDMENAMDCGKCGEDHEQLAEWLKELKERKSKCKWIKYDYRTICPKECGGENPYWRIPENLAHLKYCPYCGKEIEVEE